MKSVNEGLYCTIGRRNNLRNKILAAFSVLLIGGAVLTGCEKDDDDNNNDAGINNTDRDFVLKASMSNYAEIQAGSVAAGKAENDGIADFGQMMVTDHSDAGTKLKSIATDLRLQTKDSLDDAHMKLMDTLADVTGRDFDSVYINSQVRDHQMVIEIFQNEITNGQSLDLKQFATETLPHLQMHLNHADSLKMAY